MNAIFSFLAVDINFLYTIARKYSNSALKLYKENNPQESLYPFCLLATTSLELFLKVIIAADMCLNEKDKKHTKESIKLTVTKKLRQLDHNIKNLIEESNIENDFNIARVEEVNNGIVSDYRLYFEDKKICCFKDSQSIRFGSLARKKDLAISVGLHYTNEIVDFLNGIAEFSTKKLREAIIILKK